MIRLRKLFVSSVVLTTIIATTSGRADADTITVTSVTGVDSGLFSTATVVGEFNSQTNTFTFTATNTSAITQPGSTSSITAFAFDLPPLGNASPSGLNGFTGMQAPSLSSSFTFSDADLGNVPHGFNQVVLDFGFLTGSNFAGGQVNLGLLPGESASFTVSGAAFAGFTEEQIVNAIFVMFHNVPGAAGTEGTDVGVSSLVSAPIPEPGSMLLLGSGGVALAARLRRRRKQNATA